MRKSIRDLSALKFQVATISLVLGLGVAVLIGFTSTYDSLKRAQEIFYQQSNYPDIFISLKRAPHYALEELISLKSVQKIEGRLEFDGILAIPHYSEISSAHLISIPDGNQPQQSLLHLKKGRLPSANLLNEVVISEGMFDALQLKLGSSIFVTMNGRKTELTLVGVAVTPEQIIAIAPGNPMPDDFHFANIWMNQSLLEQRFDMKGMLNRIVISNSGHSVETEVKKEIESRLAKYGVLNVVGRDLQISHMYVTDELRQLQVQATLLPLIFFLAAVYILNVVMSRMIQTQRGEIATFKALGILDTEIIQSFLLTALVIVMLGNTLGLGLGYWIGQGMTQLYTHYYHFPILVYQLDFFRIFFAFMLTILIAGFTLVFSLRSLFKLTPAEAMRPPMSPVFHAFGLENTNWFQMLSARTKMAIRGVLSFPFKSFLNTIGLSLTIILLMSGIFWPSSLDFLVYAQYGLTQKETGQIQLTNTLSRRAVNEVLHLDGIIQAEGYRVEPIEVSFGLNQKRTSIRGVPEDAKLFSIIDQHLNEHPLPQGEIFLTSILAKQLGVKSGNTVQIHFLDGRQENISLRVGEVVESMMSNEILIAHQELAKLLKDDDKVNTILFRSLDNPILLYNKLKDLPRVVSVAFKDNSLRIFQESSAKFIFVFAMILTFFAGAIGFGVAYNNLQISLSERDWELATMQILGFQAGEVIRILASEVITLVLVSIPVGWLGGWALSWWMLKKMSIESMQIPFVMPGKVFAFSALVLIFSSLLSGIIIYYKMKKMDMIATLKTRG